MTNKVGLIAYPGGNIQSVVWALEAIGVSALVSNEKAVLNTCDRIIFPGVGAAPSAKESLVQSGLWDWIPTLEKPFLGICLGMQLMAESTEEGAVEGLGIVKGSVRKLKGHRVINMGWRPIEKQADNELLNGVDRDAQMYFVHQFGLEVHGESCVAISRFGDAFAAVVQQNNFCGVQFHPEKSGKWGLKVLENFIQWKV